MNKKNNLNAKTVKNRKTKFSYKMFLYFLLFEFVFTVISGPIIIFYGPFSNLKRQVVNSAMNTYRHQYIAKAFLSDSEINKIMSEDKVVKEKQVLDDKNGEVKIQGKSNPNIEREEISGKTYKGYALIVHDPKRIKVAITKKLGVQGQLTSQMCKDNNGVAAINGGGFNDQTTNTKWIGTGSTPLGIVMSNGVVKYSDISNEREAFDVMALTKNGVLLVGLHSIEEMKKLQVTEAIQFGPAVVINGKGVVKGDGGGGIAPRTAIGQQKDGTIILVVIDGRSFKTIGATIRDVQDIMLNYNAVNATNLDGGSSSTMVYNGEILNNPSDPLGERTIASCVYVTQ